MSRRVGSPNTRYGERLQCGALKMVQGSNFGAPLADRRLGQSTLFTIFDLPIVERSAPVLTYGH